MEKGQNAQITKPVRTDSWLDGLRMRKAETLLTT